MRTRPLLASPVALILTAAMALGLTACEPAKPTDSGPHIVTSAQSELLAITRFKNFNLGSRSFTTSITLSGVATRIQGWVDYESKLGYASVTGSFGAEALMWTDNVVGSIQREPDADGNPQFPIPSMNDADWQFKEMDPSASALFALLAAISALGQDRPDNPLLLQQSGALWLRTDLIGSTKVTVFAAPSSDSPLESASATPEADQSPLRLWVSATGVLLRAEINLNDSWSTVDFSDLVAPRLTMPE